MAENEAVEAGEVTPAPSPGRRRTLLMGGVLAGVMLVEGIGVFVLVKHFGAAPAATHGAEVSGLNPAEGQKPAEDREVQVVQFRAQNEKSQRVLTFDLTVYASVPEDKADKFTELVARRQQAIKDRFSSVVRAADAERFAEPDLATLRQQFRHELSQLAGDEELIRQVLIPTVVSFSEN